MVVHKFPSAVVLLGTVVGEKVQLLVRVPSTLAFDASALLKEGLGAIQGKGGGRKEMAQGAGTNVAGLEQALDQIVSRL